jgi:hypothetical protein
MLHPVPEDQSGERAPMPVPPDPEVPARHAKRRFTTAYKLDILRRADACTRPGELGALLRKEGLYSSHLVTWRRQRAHGLTPKKRGRQPTSSDPRVKTLEREKAALATENRRLERRLQRAETIIAFQKKFSWAVAHPRRDESDRLRRASAPESRSKLTGAAKPGKKWTRVPRHRHPKL